MGLFLTNSFPVDEVLRRRSRSNRRWNNEAYVATALVTATVAALIWANVGESYNAFWSSSAGFSAGPLAIELPLHGWVNEGLMALFLFLVGLDVRRELAVGELRQPGRALLPVAAAIGGLVVPAAIFLAVAGATEAGSAWGTVISTDTALALGLLALIGPKNAPRLRVFLLTVAVIDAIGAVLVIGIFYADDLDLVALLVAAVLLGGIWLLQRFGVWRVFPYLVLSVLTWLAVHESGVHASVAGVLIALLMPVHGLRKYDLERTDEIYHLFRQAPTPFTALTARDALVYAIPLNRRLSTVLPRYVNFIVLPLFALANAGVVVSADALASAASSTLSWGIVVGLVVGKLLGITVVAAIVVRLVPAARLPGLDIPRIAGVGALSGVGFTISLLVTSVAIEDAELHAQARIGVLSASVVAILVAIVIFRAGERIWPIHAPRGETLRRPVDPARDHVFGNLNAPVSLVVYAALSYAYRTRMEQSLRETYELIDQEQVCFVFRHHVEREEEMPVALALEAAAHQGRFWEMHDALVRFDGELDERAVHATADAIGLDAEDFTIRISSGDDLIRIADDNLDVEGIASKGDPIVYLDEHRLPGPINRWRLVESIRAIAPSSEADA